MSILEACVGIVCACGPAFPLLVRKLLPGLFTQRSASTHELETDPPGAPGIKATARTGVVPRSNITKTVVHTISVHKQDSDSITELVDDDSGHVSQEKGEGASTESHYMSDDYRNRW
jgi:hypothetical protein